MLTPSAPPLDDPKSSSPVATRFVKFVCQYEDTFVGKVAKVALGALAKTFYIYVCFLRLSFFNAIAFYAVNKISNFVATIIAPYIPINRKIKDVFTSSFWQSGRSEYEESPESHLSWCYLVLGTLNLEKAIRSFVATIILKIISIITFSLVFGWKYLNLLIPYLGFYLVFMIIAIIWLMPMQEKDLAMENDLKNLTFFKYLQESDQQLEAKKAVSSFQE